MVARDTHTVVGHPTPRAEGQDKVTGQGKYGLDIQLPEMLWCKILRSPFAHARILRVDASKARALPGVHAVLTGEDVKGMRTGRGGYRDEPVLCWDSVLFAGDKVAAVAADDEDVAQQALDLIEVEYQELPAVLSAQEAASPAAAVLHPDFNTYMGVTKQEAPTNVLTHLHRERGNIAAGFATADLVIEHTYSTPWQHQTYLEPHACLVDIDPEGLLQVWTSCQLPMWNLSEIARLTGLPQDRVVLNTTYIGGSFGGKTDATGAYLCYLMSKATGRPVKYVMDYAEELAAMNPRHPSTIRVKAGVKNDGTITAWEAEAYLATGAYAAYAPMPNGLRGVLEVAGPYRIPHVKLDLYHTYTNTVPCGFARAPGMPQGLFAGESHIDACARAIGMDPYEFRLKNLIHEGEALANGETFQSLRVEETLREAARVAGYFDEKPRYVGRGIGIGNHSQGGGEAHATASVLPDGQIVAHFSTFDTGGGTFTLIAQIVAEELGVQPSQVRVEPFPSTQLGPLNGVGGSRGARVTTAAGYEAARDLKLKLQRLAAEFFGWTEERIVLRDGLASNGLTGQHVPLEAIATRAGGPVTGRGDVNEKTSPYTSFGTHVVEVAVDPETGEVRLLKWTAVHETGTVLNPISFHGQVEGGIVYGLGEALMTETVYDESGRVTNPSFADMKIPSIRDIAPLQTVILESNDGDGPYKVRGIGEHSNIMAAPAIANAIEDAIGVRIRELPITAEKIHRVLKEKRSGN